MSSDGDGTVGSSLDPGEPHGATYTGSVPARAVGAVTNTAQNVTAQVITWLSYSYRPDLNPMLHTRKDTA